MPGRRRRISLGTAWARDAETPSRLELKAKIMERVQKENITAKPVQEKASTKRTNMFDKTSKPQPRYQLKSAKPTVFILCTSCLNAAVTCRWPGGLISTDNDLGNWLNLSFRTFGYREVRADPIIRGRQPSSSCTYYKLKRR